jgi:hypothetical protein
MRILLVLGVEPDADDAVEDLEVPQSLLAPHLGQAVLVERISAPESGSSKTRQFGERAICGVPGSGRSPLSTTSCAGSARRRKYAAIAFTIGKS